MVHQEELAVCIEKWKNYEELKKRVEKHIEESVDVRDRLKTVELRIILLEKQVLRNAILGGIIGALIGSGAAPAITSLINLFLKIGV